uniref:Uncharacterized protein n=1 Tax=Magnetospirillum gryphiswaldense TaxID=55518 RepID=A4U3C0_9PROT|nr:hypothetical protein MGR_0233 [Magnetospirillum gryphiswaldense MSR-1]
MVCSGNNLLRQICRKKFFIPWCIFRKLYYSEGVRAEREFGDCLRRRHRVGIFQGKGQDQCGLWRCFHPACATTSARWPGSPCTCVTYALVNGTDNAVVKTGGK